MKKVLIIGDSSLFRNYLGNKLEEYGLEVSLGLNGFDGHLKMRNEVPDLIIMDYMLSRKSSMEVLAEKKSNKNTAPIPAIMIATKVDQRNVVEMAKANVKKILSKPINMDVLLKTISDLIGITIKVDDTPCIIESHFNEDMLFIEIAQGLNSEKVELLKYKLTELLHLYDVKSPKILLMMTSIEFPENARPKLRRLLDLIKENAQPNSRMIQILTSTSEIISYLSTTDYSKIPIADNLPEAMDNLLGIKPDDFAHDGVVHEKLLTASNQVKEGTETVQIGHDRENQGEAGNSIFESKAVVAVVDDDLVIRELIKTVFSETSWDLQTFENGKEFLIAEKTTKFDLIFLDLLMPEVTGFQVLEYLNKQNKKLPIIVLSALSRKETIIKTINLGVMSYITKPLNPEGLQKKAVEILSSTF
ncbi:MAG: response regulator [Spirochaetia bacterium]|jgi:DNA-binding response OmpR family regulator|nr:response regulator [Spirochaetia bacterium]